MKASLKFREDQTPPLLRVKVPLNILGYPFQSGVSACGDPKDLSLNLSTFFESGPSLKLVYKPNDSWNPFSLVVKTGIGSFGSPISAPLSMSAEFNLLSKGSNNPTFFLRFNPQFGDFSVKKSSGSQSMMVKPDVEKATGWLGKFDDVEVGAKTVLPVRNRAVVKFSWGVKFPEESMKSDVSEGNLRVLKKIPFLVMNKLSIEHVARDDGKKREADLAVQVAEEGWFGVKRQLDVLHAENGMLRRAVEDLKLEICGKKSGIGNGIDRRRGGGGVGGSGERKVVDEDGDVEVKKGGVGA